MTVLRHDGHPFSAATDPEPIDVRVNPKFIAWFEAQSAQARAAIQKHWETTATDPNIQHRHKNAAYARLAIVIDRCRQVRGYEP